MKKNFKLKFKKQNGITLIALVITIIVLLILASVSIAMLTGENGILSQARRAANETNQAAQNEAAILDEYNNTLNNWINGGTTGGGETIGSKYDDGTIKIGQKITYSANGQSDWIIFGKDENGNVLITTKEPVANGFNLQVEVERWLNYEDELKNACSVYGGSIQGEKVTARSITMEDINRVTGFQKPDLSNYRYTFGETDNFANRQVNYYYPSLEASSTGYWQNPSQKPWTQGEELDSYAYGYADGQYMYVGPDNDFSGAPIEEGTINEENFKYVVGEGYKEGTFFDPYVVASRSVIVDSDGANFIIATVTEGVVYSGSDALCSSDAEGGNYGSGSASVSVRPIVVLPFDLKVEERNRNI